jgi:hypothetical protein
MLPHTQIEIALPKAPPLLMHVRRPFFAIRLFDVNHWKVEPASTLNEELTALLQHGRRNEGYCLVVAYGKRCKKNYTLWCDERLIHDRYGVTRTKTLCRQKGIDTSVSGTFGHMWRLLRLDTV